MSFLKQIAQIYAEKLTPTSQHLFVFPNRRAGLFFKKELLEITKNTIFAPQITDINSLAASISPLHKANDVELLFLLYDSYVQIRSQHTTEIESIDSFINFGTNLLADFNEIDKYLVDPKLLFSNIADIKNLNDQSQFLSEAQLSVLNSFWGNVQNERTDSLKFQSQFVTLWSNLYDIYSHFTQRLIQMGIGYDGLIYRTAIDNLPTRNHPIVFIGFNSLTTSEHRIFTHFKQLGIADFYFDYPMSYSYPSPFANTVAKFYKQNLSEFPSKYPYQQPTETHIPLIDLHSTPSTTNQINVACSIIEKNNLQDHNTAILLTDESLMPSLLQQLPNNIDKINITMGYPLALTPIATLINHILSLQTEVTASPQGTPLFYYKPLLSILSHSNIQHLFPSGSIRISQAITEGNFIRITANELTDKIKQLNLAEDETRFFVTLFTPQTSSSDLLQYLTNIVSQLAKFQFQLPTENEFLYHYNKVLRQIASIFDKNNISISLPLLRLTINRLSTSLKVQFEGEPVMGMQIMGLLESRLLDFDNIILVGFNDAKIPGSKSINTIIPYNVRLAYNLPTTELSDAIQAYNFYRTLYHTQHIHLIYDSRSDNAQNEISRYFYQMKYLLNAPLYHHNYTLPIDNNSVSQQPISIQKNKDIIDKLNSFKNTDSLSASKLKYYITCPLKFYFSTIANIDTPDRINELEESSLLGRIYHHAMELYYNNTPTPPKELSKEEIHKLVSDAFDIESNKSKKRIKIEGFNALIFNVVRKFITNTIDFDIRRYNTKNFNNVDSEVKILTKIGDVNFIAFIDRTDNTSGTTNIIDYKTTSSKEPSTTNIINLFTSHDKFYHEVFQVLFYCYLYKLQFGTTPMFPTLYKILSLKSSTDQLTSIKLTIPNQLLDDTKLPPLDIDLATFDPKSKDVSTITVTDYAQISTPFEWLVSKLLHDIYNPDIPFTQRPHCTIEKGCKYCSYTAICKKPRPKDNN